MAVRRLGFGARVRRQSAFSEVSIHVADAAQQYGRSMGNQKSAQFVVGSYVCRKLRVAFDRIYHNTTRVALAVKVFQKRLDKSLRTYGIAYEMMDVFHGGANSFTETVAPFYRTTVASEVGRPTRIMRTNSGHA